MENMTTALAWRWQAGMGTPEHSEKWHGLKQHNQKQRHKSHGCSIEHSNESRQRQQQHGK